jgi:hypothetical protein
MRGYGIRKVSPFQDNLLHIVFYYRMPDDRYFSDHALPGEQTMDLALPLDKMTASDKLRTMEALWNDLCKHSDELDSPAWHGELLANRDNRLLEGKEAVYDWADAKERIRRSI